MNEFQIKLFREIRILFVISDCPKCGVWKSFIERYNTEVPIAKRIKIIDSTTYTDFGIRTPMINLFKEIISEDGLIDFPILLFEGMKVTGANSREEAEAFIKVALHKDFIIPKENEYLFEKKCRYETKGILRGKALICEPFGGGE